MEHENRPDGPCIAIGGVYYPLELGELTITEQSTISELMPFDEFAEVVDQVEERGFFDPRAKQAMLWVAIHRIDKRATLSSVGELVDSEIEWLEAKEEEIESDSPPPLEGEGSPDSPETFEQPEEDWARSLAGTGDHGAL
jgi:hypothetical protein